MCLYSQIMERVRKTYSSPALSEIEIDKVILMKYKSVNGAGKVPPGWENPHNPHNPSNPKHDGNNGYGMDENPFALADLTTF